jgi:phosphonate transport system permease protein
MPPPIRALASALVPGAGQALAGQRLRGLMLFAGLLSAAALLAWRFALAARGLSPLWEALERVARVQPILAGLAVLWLLLYLWNIADAYHSAGGQARRSGLGLALGLLVLFFGLGWQIGQVSLPALVDGAQTSSGILRRIFWPWERAISVPRELRVVGAEIQTPCGSQTRGQSTGRSGPAALRVEPACGVPSEATGLRGTTFRLSGSGFQPPGGGEDRAIEIWWRDPLGSVFPHRQNGEPLMVQPEADGSFDLRIVMPYWLLPPIGEDEEQGPLTWQVQARQPAALGTPQPSRELLLVGERTVETVFMALVATVLGALVALPLGWLCALGMGRGRWLAALGGLVRAGLGLARALPALVWAILAVLVVGLGPFAGILALSLHTTAALALRFAETLGGLPAADGSRALAAPLALAALLRWERNLRLAAVVGLVGGGGIGFLLAQWVRLLDYTAAGLAIWAIILILGLLQLASAGVRRRFFPLLASTPAGLQENKT